MSDFELRNHKKADEAVILERRKKNKLRNETNRHYSGDFRVKEQKIS